VRKPEYFLTQRKQLLPNAEGIHDYVKLILRPEEILFEFEWHGIIFFAARPRHWKGTFLQEDGKIRYFEKSSGAAASPDDIYCDDPEGYACQVISELEVHGQKFTKKSIASAIKVAKKATWVK
jgi:hypothetical protein